VFLSGASAALAIQNKPSTRRYLLQRGLLLIGIEFTLVNFALSFDPQFRLLIFEVIATIGAGLVLLSFLSRLPAKFLLAFALLILFGHDLLPPPPAMSPNQPSIALIPIIRSLFFSPGGFQVSPHLLIVIAYPILPWLGIMLAGFSAGRWFEKPAPQRKKLFLRLGLGTLIAIAFLIASPLVWYFMNQWLQQYAYRITIGAWIFAATIFGSLCIAWLTVGYTAITAARANPINSLRME
jgi:uncharacterized membrane protein